MTSYVAYVYCTVIYVVIMIRMLFKLLYVCYYLHVKRCEPGSLLGYSAIKIINLLLLSEKF